MTKRKVLKYAVDNSSLERLFISDKNNLTELSKDLDKLDVKDANIRVAELLKYIGDIYNQEKYKNNPKSIKVLKSGKLELKFEYHPLKVELTEEEKAALKKFGDYNKIDVKNLVLSKEILICCSFYKAYTLGDIIKTGEETFSTLRRFGKKSKRELRNLIYRFDPEAYKKYIGEKK